MLPRKELVDTRLVPLAAEAALLQAADMPLLLAPQFLKVRLGTGGLAS